MLTAPGYECNGACAEHKDEAEERGVGLRTAGVVAQTLRIVMARPWIVTVRMILTATVIFVIGPVWVVTGRHHWMVEEHLKRSLPHTLDHLLHNRVGSLICAETKIQYTYVGSHVAAQRKNVCNSFLNGERSWILKKWADLFNKFDTVDYVHEGNENGDDIVREASDIMNKYGGLERHRNDTHEQRPKRDPHPELQQMVPDKWTELKPRGPKFYPTLHNIHYSISELKNGFVANHMDTFFKNEHGTADTDEQEGLSRRQSKKYAAHARRQQRLHHPDFVVRFLT